MPETQNNLGLAVFSAALDDLETAYEALRRRPEEIATGSPAGELDAFVIRARAEHEAARTAIEERLRRLLDPVVVPFKRQVG